MVVRVLTPTQKNQCKKSNTKKATTTVHCYAAMKIHNNNKKGRKKKKHVHKDFWKTFKKLRWWWYCTFPSPTVFYGGALQYTTATFLFCPKVFCELFPLFLFFFVLFCFVLLFCQSFYSFDADFPFS